MIDMKIDNSTLSFLSDWRKRTSKQQRKSILLFVLMFLLTFAICLLAGFWFQNRNYNRIITQNQNYIQDTAIQEANQIERRMSEGVALIQNFSKQFAVLRKYGQDPSIDACLERVADATLFDRISFVTPEGEAISHEGVADVSDRHYFKEAMAGNSGWDSIEKSRVTGRPNVIFYTPVTIDGEIVGTMSGYYEMGRMNKLFDYELFNYKPNTYLLNGEGEVISSSRNEMIGENLFDRLSEKKFVGDANYDDIMDLIEDRERTTGTFSYMEDGRVYVGVVVQFLQGDWMLFSILPYDITENMVLNANRNGMMFLVAIVIAFTFAIILILLTYRRMNLRYGKEMTMAVDSLYSTVENEEHQLSVIRTLADVYSSVYYINAEDRSYQRIRESQAGSIEKFPEAGAWKDSLNGYCDSFVAQDYRERMREFISIEPRLNRKNADRESMEYLRIDEQWRRANMIPMLQDGETVGYIFAVEGIDEEKKKELKTKKALEEAYEAAQLANNAKTSFLSNMSHDIRTPMNAIIGMTAIASAHIDEPEKITDCLKKITMSSKHLLGLINEILDMSKIESGKVDLYEEEFSLSELMDTLVSLNMPLVKEKNHTLLVTAKDIVHENVIGDSTRLQQVLTNLLTNAIKYTPENGRIEITVTEKTTNKPTIGWYEIVVKDNGIGMSEDYMQKIFEPFVRSSDKRIAGIQGTGLGMPIARNILRMMNGDIKVESKLNEGSTFTVSFTLKLQVNEDVDYDQFINLPVLVVDDDEMACESTCEMLNALRMDSEWVTTGKEAIVKMVEHHDADNDYYAVIVDWKMPDMDGLEVTKQIRERISEDIPIIIISAYDWMDIEKEARQAGVNAFLSKPLFRSKLVGLFNDLVNEEHKKGTTEKDVIKEQEYDFSGKRILLVEDNEMNREIAVELLSMIGLEMETAEDGKEGLEKFEASETGYYDMILMDVQMPVMNGYEATQAIRRLPRMDANTVPIIAMTANAFSTDVRDAYDAGMNGHIAKPIDMNHVVEVLGDYLLK